LIGLKNGARALVVGLLSLTWACGGGDGQSGTNAETGGQGGAGASGGSNAGGSNAGGSNAGGSNAGGSGSGGSEALPPNPGPTGLYLGIQSDITPVITPKDKPVTWGAAPPIDKSYGGTLYVGTTKEGPDPRPPLQPDGNEPLRLWVADPNNGLTDRPAIIWLHGGGFAVGIDSMYGLANTDGKEYAARGYVGFSVEYRVNTTLIGDKSLCQWVQDNAKPGDPVYEARKEECKQNILAAQRDALAAVRWVRRHASEYGVDPQKIAVGGFSAGAVTASNAAYQGDDIGTIAYSADDDLSVAASRIQGGFGASGCTYSEDLTKPPATIGAGDAPVSLIHSEFDQAVPYACAAMTVNTARSFGLVAELHSYCDAGGHADDLYKANKAATDEQWTTFLTRELKIYSGMPPATAEPTCP